MQFQNKNNFVGILLVLFASIAFSSKSVIVKLVYKEGIDSVSALFLRMSIALPFFLIVSFLELKKKKLEKKILMQIFLLGFLGYYLSSLLDFIGLEYISAGLERLILFTYPTIVILISFFFLNKKIIKIEIISLIVCYLGILIVFFSESLVKNKETYLGITAIFVCSITYAIYLLGSGEIIPKVGASLFTSLAMSVACLSICMQFFLMNKVDKIFTFTPRVWFLGFLMAILNTLLPTFLLSNGIKKIGSTSTSIIASIGPVSTIILAWIFLDEKIGINELIGTMLVILGVVLVSQKK